MIGTSEFCCEESMILDTDSEYKIEAALSQILLASSIVEQTDCKERQCSFGCDDFKEFLKII